MTPEGWGAEEHPAHRFEGPLLDNSIMAGYDCVEAQSGYPTTVTNFAVPYFGAGGAGVFGKR